jgi:hypothetical protein
MRYVAFAVVLLILSSCCGEKSVTRTTVYERIDTTITIAPDTVVWRTPLTEIIDRPQTFENDRSKTTVIIRRDTVEIETICKPDTVRVFLERTTETKTKTRKPRRIIPWWVWFIGGAVSVVILRAWLRS